MNMQLPAIEDYARLIPVARQLYEHTSGLAWQMLLPLFLLSVTISYSTDLGLSGAILLRLKRLVLVAILLATFPMIAEFCQVLGVEVAKSIDDFTGIDQLLDAASKKAEGYSFNLETLLRLQSDFLFSILVILSFVVLILARFFLLAFQHFYWLLLVVLGPFFILGLLFETSSGVTKNLFKNMIQVAAWPIIWAVLSAFLKALPFADAYMGDGSTITVITLNLIIAVALLFSPFLVSQLTEGAVTGTGDRLKQGALKALSYMNPKTFAANQMSARGSNYARKKFTK